MNICFVAVQVTAKAASQGRTNRDNAYIRATFTAGLAANRTFGSEEALGVVDASWTRP